MKKKHHEDHFDTRCWNGTTITDPRQVIAELFSQAGIDFFRTFMGKLLCHAGEAKSYRHRSPGDTLLYMKSIRSLILAAHELKATKRSAIRIAEADLVNKKYYASHYETSDEWTDFPRFLSKKDCCNPYRVFRKFFTHLPVKEWLHYWEELVETALSRSRGEPEGNVIAIYRHLVKLVEAAHLVDVREVTHVGGFLKLRDQK